MKRVVLVILGCIFALSGYAQTNGDDNKIPKQSLPTNSANYRLTIDITERNMSGNLLNHNIGNEKIIELSRVSLSENTIQFEDVNITEVSEQGQHTRKLDELEKLSFKIQGDNFTSIDFYKDCPPAQVELIRMFIQDKVTFEVWGQMYLDSLELNVPFYPDLFNNHQADFEQNVNFNTQNLNIIWLGYSKINEKDCILVHFKSMFSPFLVDNDMVIVNGRSCFWGNIWILPETRQIEYAVMNEDIVLHTKLKNNDFEQQLNRQREVIHEKVE